MKSSPAPQRQSSAPASVSTPSGEALGFDSPTYGTLAAEIAQAGAPPVQGYQMDAADAHPVQLRAYPYATQADAKTKGTYRAAFTAIEARVDREVQAAREQALNWGDYDGDDNARLALWAATAQEYYDDPTQAPNFIHARFGYAIEELSTAQLPANSNGLSINLQVAAGHTRPDIVLRDGDDDVAWIDITAEDSKGHILGKQGAGWKNRPFVSEILYDSLELNEVLEGMDNPMLQELGGYYAAKNQITFQERERQTTRLRNTLTTLQNDNDWVTGVGNAADKRTDTRAALEGLGMNLGRTPQVAAKGALAYAEVNAGPFGFGADIKSSTAVARDFVHAQAQPEILRRSTALNTARATNIRDRIRNHHDCPARTNYLTALAADVRARRDLSEAIRVGIALDYALDEFNEGTALSARIARDHAADGRTAAVVAALNAQLDDLPADPNYVDLRAWSNGMKNPVFNANLLVDLIDKAAEFDQYLYQYYGAAGNPTQEENEILRRLNDAPEDYQVIDNADRYMTDNP